ncbi:cupin domain-containing protein [Thalassospira sp.]|uniref:cupin domain-containing protein n=1 Tax=Thalassospira sp. TaxID=1912094 RepID=UPI002734EA2D|nr:cupin domain-containing protein [Thalassospira sp.]MDP2697639.1 cupin domain-containing protein [Thalassospira sp.]
MKIWAAAVICMVMAGSAWAEGSGSGTGLQGDYDKVTPLLDTSRNIIGETLVYPDSGAAKVTSLIVTMEPGETTGWHKHGVPIYGYILEGQVTIDYGVHGKRSYQAGAAFMEAMDNWHDALNDGDGPVRILVVFMGAEGAQNVIRKPE